VAGNFRFKYTVIDDNPNSLMPRLQMALQNRGRSVDVIGLLDTGAAVNVLPYHVGAVWEKQNIVVPLTGNLRQFEARGLIVNAFHPQLTSNKPIELVFAWTTSDNAPILLGQMNFFAMFDVCFFRAEHAFEVRQR